MLAPQDQTTVLHHIHEDLQDLVRSFAELRTDAYHKITDETLALLLYEALEGLEQRVAAVIREREHEDLIYQTITARCASAIQRRFANPLEREAAS